MASKADYLKKYLSGGDDKKKKKKKRPKTTAKAAKKANLAIMDDDVDWRTLAPKLDPAADSDSDPDEAPVVTEVHDEAAVRWQPLGTTRDQPLEDENSVLRRGRYSSSPDLSPLHPGQRGLPDSRGRLADMDLSPPRRAGMRGVSPDMSPPRRREGKHDSPDFTPPRKTSRWDSKAAAPSHVHQRRASSSPDFSPPRRSGRHDSPDLSPPRRSGRHDSPDLSPPRKSGRHDSPDLSPPRKSGRHDSPDLSPPQRTSRVRHDTPEPGPLSGTHSSLHDASLPKKPVTKNTSPTPSSMTDKDARGRRHGGGERMMSGTKSGLQSAEELKRENALSRRKQEDFYKSLDPETSGRHAETVRRDKTGRKIDPKLEKIEQREKDRLKEEESEKFMQWGRGLAQVQQANERVQEELYEMSKPLARYADDEDLERMLKARERDGDPMLAYVQKKRTKVEAVEGKSRKQRPSYRGVVPPNRFGVRPGYRWDGVDRSNGFEKTWFATQSNKKAIADEAYKWSVEDM